MINSVYKLSPSSIRLFLECERCFWLRMNEGVERPGGIFPTLPSGMDRVLKEHFDRFRAKNKLPPELTKNGFSGSLFKDQKLIDEWRELKTCLKTELPDVDTVVRGMIDDLLVDKDGVTLIPFDFKTKGSAPGEDYSGHYHHQLCIYGWLLERNGYDVDEKAYLLVYHPDAVQEDGSVTFNASLVKVDIDPEDAEELVRRAVKMLGKEIPKRNSECGFCGMGGD